MKKQEKKKGRRKRDDKNNRDKSGNTVMALLTTATLTKPPLISSLSSNSTSTSSSSIKFQLQTHNFTRLYVLPQRAFHRNPRTSYSVRKRHVVCMAPEEEKMTRRSPLDFPIVSLLQISSFSSFFKFYILKS